MNVPDRKYLIHKAVEFDALTKVAAAAMEKAREEGNTAVQWKYDGCNCVAILSKPGVIALYSRTGEPVRSMRHIEQQLLATFPVQKYGPQVILGEAWLPDTPHQQISGMFRRHSDSPELQFVVFDAISLDDFMAGVSSVPWKVRFSRVADIIDRAETPPLLAKTFFYPAGYGGWREIHDKMMTEHPVGFDGVIERDVNSPWEAGSGTAGGIVKHKLRPTVDLRVLDIEEGQRANAGKVGNLVVELNPEQAQGVGTGISRTQREEWFIYPDRIVGQIVEVSYLSKTADGKLREPVVEGIRHDKEEADTV